MRLALAVVLCAAAQAQSYKVEKIDVPRDIRLEVGGMGFWPDGTLVMCTRRGEVWLYAGDRFRRFTFGLHEPLGLLTGKDGEIWVMQRGELTHIVDTDGDREADSFETLNQDWGYTGNYHQYAFGLVRDREGSFYGTLGLGFYKGGDRFKSAWLGTQDDIKYRGWVIQITKDGKLVPFAPGLRAPNGIGLSPQGELFTTDNQGSWVATGWLMHVRKGDFLGHPSGLIDDPRFEKPWEMPREKLEARRKRPAVFLPHGTMGNSTAQPIWDTTGGKFGPFAGQVLLGEVQNGKLGRVTLEKIGGEWQGACYPFLHGKLGGGANRLCFDREGVLWIGFTGRGWAAGEGLQKVTYTGRPPFALHTMRLADKGFDLVFTAPVDAAVASDPASYSVNHFEYAWGPGYGAPPSKRKVVKVLAARVASDRRTVTLELSELPERKIYSLHFGGSFRSAGGAALDGGFAFYTLNRRR